MANLLEWIDSGVKASIDDRRARERDRLARCAAESRRLSLEECCYWLLVIEYDAAASAVARRDTDALALHMRHARNDVFSELKVARLGLRHQRANSRRRARESMTVRWLCREALRRIEEERR